MKRFAVLLVASALVSIVPAYGNRFLDSLVGDWRVTTQYSAGNKQSSERFNTSVRKLKKGVYHFVNYGGKDGRQKEEEAWLYRSGKIRGAVYDNGRRIGRVQGKWRLSRGTLATSTVSDTVHGLYKDEDSIQRINGNKYMESGKVMFRGQRASYISTIVRRR